MPSFAVFTDALTGTCLGAISLKDETGGNYNYAGDVSKLYQIASTAVTDKSKGGGYSTGANEKWRFTKWGETVIATNYSDVMQTIAIGGAQFADLGGTPPKARDIAVVKNFVVAVNTWDAADEEMPHRAWWCGFEDPTTWTPSPTTQADYQDLIGNGGACMAIVGGEYGTIFQERSIWRMTYIGAPFVFQFDEIEAERGTLSRGSVVNLGGIIFYLSLDGFYMFNGSQSIPIGEGKVNRWFFRDADRTKFVHMSSTIDPLNSLIMWSYVSNSASDNNPDKILLFHWPTQKWSVIEQAHETMLQSLTTGWTLEGLDDYGGVGLGDLDTLPFGLDSSVWMGGDLKLGAFSTSHKLGYFDGTPMYAMLETGEYQLTPGRVSMLTGVQPIVDQGVIALEVASRMKQDESIIYPRPSVLQNWYGYHPYRLKGRYHTFRFNITNEFEAVGFEPDFNGSSRK
jgi:hypothetical protein